MNYPHIAARVFNTPLLVEPDKMQHVLAFLAPRLGFTFEASTPLAFSAPPEAQRHDGGFQVQDGVAVINVFGMTVQRSAFMDDTSGMVSYDRLAETFRAALGDRSVKSILLNMDSPGGEVHGLFDFADEIFEARGAKPMTAVVADRAASAAYVIAAAADEVVVTRTSETGSLGALFIHVDRSERLRTEGLKVSLIFAGERKVDGNPFEPLAPAAAAAIQADIDQTYDLLTGTIGRYRGTKLTQQQAIETEAAIYRGRDALGVGLADRVSTARAEFDRLRAESTGGASRPFVSTPPGGLEMSDPKEKVSDQEPIPGAGSDANTAAQPTMQALDTARTEGHAAGVTEGRTLAATETKERIKAIMTSEHAAGRETLAQHLAYETDMPVEAATATLEAAPKAEAKVPEMPDRLAAAMAGVDNPDIDAGGGEDDGDDPKALATSLVETARAAGVVH